MELYLLVSLLVFRVSVIHGLESIQDVTAKLYDMSKSLQEVKTSISEVRDDVVDLEQKYNMDLNLAKSDLKDHVTNTIVPTFVRSQVERALEDIFMTRSVDSLINSHVMKTLEKQKKVLKVLKNNLRFYVERFSQSEREIIKMKAELAKVKQSLKDVRHDNGFQSSEVLNYKSKINRTLEQPDDTGIAAVRNTPMSGLASTIASSVTHHQHNMSRVLYLSYAYKSVPMQLSLKNNHLQTFPLHLDNVGFTSVVFEPTSRKIIFSLYEARRNKICSSDLEGGAVMVIRYGISSYGLAVDTNRNVIFMTTVRPGFTISRMRPDGSELRVIADVSKYNYAFSIAVVPDKQLIYSTHMKSVVETSYDGVFQRIIARGTYMRALDYDRISHTLYYASYKTLKRWSSSNEESVPIYNLTTYPSSLQFYRNSLYIGYRKIKELGVVSLNKEESVYWKLAEGQDTGIWVCLIP